MNTSQSKNGIDKERAKDLEDSVPYPEGLLAAMETNPGAALALICALDQLLTSGGEQLLPPDTTNCPVCNTGY